MSLSIRQRIPLFAAAETGDVASLETFFQQQAVRAVVEELEVFVTNNDQRARNDGYMWYFIPLLDKSDDYDKLSKYQLRSVFDLAIRANQFEVVAWFFSPAQIALMGKTLASEWIRMLLVAGRSQNLEIVELLLNASVSFFSDNQRAAMLNDMAIKTVLNVSGDLMQLLLAHGTQIDSVNASSGFQQCENADMLNAFVAEGLVTVGADALYSSVYCGKTDVAKRLLQLGVDSGRGTTALHTATIAPHVAVVELLVSEGLVDLDARDPQGRTALMKLALPDFFHGLGSGNERGEAAKVLLNAGADFTLKDCDGKTALHHAASREFPRIVEALLLHGADPNEADNNGATALDCVDLASITCIENPDLLLHHGADPYITGHNSIVFVDRLMESEAGRTYVATHPQYFANSRIVPSQAP